MSEIKAVLFDLGGTLLRGDGFAEASGRTLCQVAGLEQDRAGGERAARAMRAAFASAGAAFVARPFYLHRELFAAVAAAALAELGVEPTAVRLAAFGQLMAAAIAEPAPVRDGVHETLRELRARGLHLGIVSNVDEEHLWPLARNAGLEPLFDSLLSSEAAGSCKPDPRIFAEALRRAGCAADEALFVGDMLPFDIAGANRAGMRSVLITDGMDLAPLPCAARPVHVIHTIPEVLLLLR